MTQLSLVGVLLLVVAAATSGGGPPKGPPSRKGEPADGPPTGLAGQLRDLHPAVLPRPRREALATMLADDLRTRIQAANDRSRGAWRSIRDREDWERFRATTLERLRQSLGQFPSAPDKPDVRTAGTLAGDGYHIDKLVLQSRPGLWVTATLYRPAKPGAAMPGLLLCHSHHAPKHQGELQDMGATWARQGCVVLVPDLLGHGERRQHPFVTAADYRERYRVGRQDYYFRYDVGMQLHLVGESLMGWLAWDLWRCVDVLLAQPGVDPTRIILLGAVAGGGDPAAVAAALDRRIGAAVPFNFGGAQPETRYPLPEDAERTFNYAGSGSFESTRNLRRSAADGFLPWAIVAGVAPRPLIYAHEFAWDRERDPVWKRLERVWRLCGSADRVAATHGRGSVKGRPPESTHCGNIGRVHREGIHPLFKRWFGIQVTPDDEHSHRRTADDLRCMTPELERELRPQRLCDLLPGLAAQRLAAARERLAGKTPGERRRLLRAAWASVLGDVVPKVEPRAESFGPARQGQPLAGAKAERVALTVEPGIVVPLILLLPRPLGAKRAPCVVAVAQGGKEGFLRQRAGAIAELLAGGAAVCLPDVRGIGETKPDGSRERWASITAHSSTELMLGGTLVGARLRDLRSVLRHLRSRGDVDGERLALWGDSFAAVNPPETDFKVPRNVDGRPRWSEPLGGLLALLAGLCEEGVAAVYVRGGLSDFQSVLPSQFVYIPHDVLVPGVLTIGDLPDLAAALAPRALRLDALVDGLNRRRPQSSIAGLYRPASDAYQKAGARTRIALNAEPASPAAWLLEQLTNR